MICTRKAKGNCSKSTWLLLMVQQEGPIHGQMTSIKSTQASNPHKHQIHTRRVAVPGPGKPTNQKLAKMQIKPIQTGRPHAKGTEAKQQIPS